MTVQQQIILLLVYIFGFIISYNMLRIDHVSEKQVYTKGQRLANYCFSIFSFLSVLIILIITWIATIKKTGYWKLPVKEPKPEAE